MSNFPPGVSVIDPNIDPQPDGRATIRTYRVGRDHVDRWRCPVCGHQNEETRDIQKDDDGECAACGAWIILNYRIMRGRNY